MTCLPILDGVEQLNIVVVGDVMLDEYVYCRNRFDDNTESSMTNSYKLHVLYTEWVLGGAANLAQHCASLGARVTLISPIATDTQGQWIAKTLCSKGIDIPNYMRIDSPTVTTVKTRLYLEEKANPHKLYTRLDKDSRCTPFVNFLLDGLDKVRTPDILLFSDYNKGGVTRKIIHEVSSYAWEANKEILVCGNLKPALCIQDNQMDLLQVNAAEAASLKGMNPQGDWPESIGEIEHLVVTHGTKGSEMMVTGINWVDNYYAHLPEHRIQEEASTVGCGDASFALGSIALKTVMEPGRVLAAVNAGGIANTLKSPNTGINPAEALDLYVECLDQIQPVKRTWVF